MYLSQALDFRDAAMVSLLRRANDDPRAPSPVSIVRLPARRLYRSADRL